MSRPETIDNLPHEKRFTPAVTLHNLDALDMTPDMLRDLAAIQDAITGTAWLTVEEDVNGSVIYSRPKTDRELDNTLRLEQVMWDTRQRLYEGAAAGKNYDYFDRCTVNEHAEAEGLDPIDWDAMDAAKGGEGR